MAIASFVLLPAAYSLAADQKVRFQIASQDLQTALNQFALQSKKDLLFAPEIAAAKRSKALNGEYSPEDALKLLLAGTGLIFRSADDRTILVETPRSGTKDNHTSGLMELSAEGLRLALSETLLEAAEQTTPDSGTKAKKGKRGNDGVEEMIVEEGRIKPYNDANVDIPRTINDPQPYYVFDSATLEKSGATNIEEFLKQRLTMNTTARTWSQATDGLLATNISEINLRGLGSRQTLVLVNGRKLAGPTSYPPGNLPFGAPAQADLNGIPLSAVERIEVLPSSASGIYGANALGGVVNVILKREFTGGDLRLTYDNTWDTDAPNRTVAMSYGRGFNGGRTQARVSMQWSDGSALLIQDRRAMLDRGMQTVLRNNPALIYSTTSPFFGALPNITPSDAALTTLTFRDGTPVGSRATYVPAGTSLATSAATLRTGLIGNAGVWNLDLPAVFGGSTGLFRPMTIAPENQSVNLSLRHEIRSGFEVFVDYSHNINKSVNVRNIDGVPTSLTLEPSSPVNPFNSRVRITTPIIMGGPIEYRSITDSATLGFTAKLPGEWTLETDYTWSKNNLPQSYGGFDGNLFSEDANAGLINPFVDLLANPIDLTKYMGGTNYAEYNSVSQDVGVRGSGPLFSIYGIVPRLTVGLGHRALSRPQVIFNRTYPNASRNEVWINYPDKQVNDSVYGEVSVPLVESGRWPLVHDLQAQVAARVDRYDVNNGTGGKIMFYSGNTPSVSFVGPTLNGEPFTSRTAYQATNHTLGFKYSPVADFALRASKATAFLPPSPDQLLKNPRPNDLPTTVLDRQNNNGSVSVQTIGGGNPGLKPQDSKSTNIGFIWEPSLRVLAGLRLNAEYYRIEQFNAIGNLSAQLIVDNEALFPGRVLRSPSGAITLVDTSSLNLYKRDTEGWDLSAGYTLKTSAGTFDLQAVESIITSLKTQYSLTLPAYDAAGFPSEGGAAKYKSSIILNWDLRNWSAAWTARYIGSYKQNGALGGPAATRARATNPNAVLNTTYISAQGGDTVPSQIYHDLFISYAFGKEHGRNASAVGSLLSNVTLQLGSKNVFNTLPPLDVSYNFYISPFGDTRLRSYWVSFKRDF